MRRFVTLVVLLTPGVAHAEWPTGAELEPAVFVDVTKPGFDALGDTVPDIAPDELPVPDVYQSGSVDLWLTDFDWSLSVTNLLVGLDVQDVNITPGDGLLYISATATINLNDGSNPANVYVDSDIGELLDCDLVVDPFNVDIATTLTLKIVEDETGKPVLDATLGAIDWSWDLVGDDIYLGCWVGTVNDILDLIGLNLFDLAIGLLEDQVDGMIQDLTADLDQQIEDAFNTFSIKQDLPILSTVLHIDLHPSDIEVTPAGLRLATAGSTWADHNPCIDDNGVTGSLETDFGLPGLGDVPDGVENPYHIGIVADDDFLNQLLFAAYDGGVLCYTMDGAEQTDLPLNTALLAILAPNVFDPLFPETKPLLIKLHPTSPPVATTDGDHDVNIVVDRLELDFIADLDYRKATIVGLDLDVDAGADLNFDGSTGVLALQIALSKESLKASTRLNEFAPAETDAVIAAAIPNLFDTVVGPLLGDALSGFSFTLPSFGAAGLQSLEAGDAGPGEEMFGFYGQLGNVPYGSGELGCDDEGGCSTGEGGGCAEGGGCESSSSGCSVSGPMSGRLLLLLVPAFGAVLRRRRKS